ncbi:UNVERIFIED_CONTAM: hypothetical protein FKN15_057854 [Acipenser sinensis]
MLRSRRSVLNASALDARTFGARRSTRSARRVDPRCTSVLVDQRSVLVLGARSLDVQCLLRRRSARKAVGDHSPSSGSSHTLSAPPAATPVRLRLSRSPSSQLTAGQRSPRQWTHPSIQPQDPSPYRARSPRRRGHSRSPRREKYHRDRSGVIELTSKMSQFMEVMMGQQSLLMTLANRVPQGTRDASEGEHLLKEDRMEAELVSHHSEQESELEVLDTNDPLWPLVERATRHLGIEWAAFSPAPPVQDASGIPRLYQGGAVHLGGPGLCLCHFSQGFGLHYARGKRNWVGVIPNGGRCVGLFAAFAAIDADAIWADQGSCLPEQAMQDYGGAPQKGVRCGHRGSQAVKRGQPPNGLPGGAHSRPT